MQKKEHFHFLLAFAIFMMIELLFSPYNQIWVSIVGVVGFETTCWKSADPPFAAAASLAAVFNLM